MHGLVVVGVNYRQGGLGFFASEGLRAEDKDGGTGNMGLLDQRAALQWVQKNIKNFGGNPGSVTLFGESAGAFSVAWHLVSPPSWPLFHRAVSSSGTALLSWFFQPYEGKAQEFYRQWAVNRGCSSQGAELLACLRKLPAKDLVDPPPNITVSSPAYDPWQKYPDFPVGPVIDGTFLKDLPINLMRAGKFHKVPLLIGTNHDDGYVFKDVVRGVVKMKNVNSEDDIKKFLDWAMMPSDVQNILNAYPASSFAKWPVSLAGYDYDGMMSSMLRDLALSCSSRAVADAWYAHGLSAYVYQFSPSPELMEPMGGIVHGLDLSFWWHHYDTLKWVMPFDDLKGIATLMSCKMATFAYTGSPNAAFAAVPLPSGCVSVQTSNAQWPAYNTTDKRFYSIRKKSVAVQIPDKAPVYPNDEFPSNERCDMWAKVDFPWRPIPSATKVLEQRSEMIV
jgi:para-nitrobenzyl esterase